MSYQEQLKRKLNRNNIKYLILYAVLGFIFLSGAMAGLLNNNSVMVLSLLPVSTRITGTIFLFLFVLMLIMIVRTIGAIISQKTYLDLCESIKRFGSPETVLAYIGNLPKNPLCTHGELRFDKRYISFVLDDLCIVRPMHEVDWGYLESEVEAAKAASKRGHSLQLPSSPTPVVDILLEDNYVLNIRASSVNKAEELLAEIKKVNPEMAIGFTQQNASIYKNNPRNMRSRANIPQGEED